MHVTRRHRTGILFAPLLVSLLAGCAGAPAPGTPLERRGDEIMVCGELFHTGTPVVLWTDPGGYDAYRVHRRFVHDGDDPLGEKARYGPERHDLPDDLARRVEDDGWRLQDLQKVVRMFVLHYDVCGTSRQCFKVLQDVRGLSVHFMLDVDGTIYQTLDLKERAWHAGVANDASVGIEIAQIGAYPSPDHATLKTWYRKDQNGVRIEFPDWMAETGIRTPGFVPRPARDALIAGEVQGETYYQYDFTDAQYEALAKLAATLHRVLPRIALAVPRDAEGHVVDHTLDEQQLAHFEGILGHWHVSDRKIDPGPAFDWDRLLETARDQP